MNMMTPQNKQVVLDVLKDLGIEVTRMVGEKLISLSKEMEQARLQAAPVRIDTSKISK